MNEYTTWNGEIFHFLVYDSVRICFEHNFDDGINGRHIDFFLMIDPCISSVHQTDTVHLINIQQALHHGPLSIPKNPQRLASPNPNHPILPPLSQISFLNPHPFNNRLLRSL